MTRALEKLILPRSGDLQCDPPWCQGVSSNSSSRSSSGSSSSSRRRKWRRNVKGKREDHSVTYHESTEWDVLVQLYSFFNFGNRWR